MPSTHSSTSPIVLALQVGLQVLFAALVGFVGIMAVVAPSPSSGAVIALVAGMVVTYLAGFLVHMSRTVYRRHALGFVWLALLTVEWIVMMWLTPHAAYIAFPLFFLFLELLPGMRGVLAVILVTVAAVGALGLHNGWSVGGVVGPIVGAGVAILIGLTYQALRAESAEHRRLYRELVETQHLLAATERETGILEERARLAREIHDTVAQGLSSISLLLHAAERTDPLSPAMPTVRLARETATVGLAETRGFIRELTPPLLAEQGIGGALRRLAGGQWVKPGLTVEVRVADILDLPMPIQTAFLRIAQGAMANVLTHAAASVAVIEIDSDDVVARLSVVDDGVGFDVSLTELPSAATASDSFGLRAMRERVEQLDGTLRITSSAAEGTRVSAEVPLATVDRS